MSLDIDEVRSVSEYNDFLDVEADPQVHEPQADRLPHITEDQSENLHIDLETCDNCGRKFFSGKLQYHLKICTKQKPMLRSPAKSEKGKSVVQACLIGSQGQIDMIKLGNNGLKVKNWMCPQCNLKVPIAIAQFHKDHCTGSLQSIVSSVHTTPRGVNAKKSTLPRIISKHEPIKIREELSCFARAACIQQVECIHCGRKFDKHAALRHVPVCELLMDKRDMKVKHKISTAHDSRVRRNATECTVCKRVVADGHKYCGFCGTKKAGAQHPSAEFS